MSSTNCEMTIYHEPDPNLPRQRKSETSSSDQVILLGIVIGLILGIATMHL